jgi:hypothetical protein
MSRALALQMLPSKVAIRTRIAASFDEADNEEEAVLCKVAGKIRAEVGFSECRNSISRCVLKYMSKSAYRLALI